MSQEGQKGKFTMALCALGAAFALVPGVASAADINVTTTADEFNTNNAACSLREAVQAANTNAAFGGCTAGSVSSPDTITLTSGQTYGLTIPDVSDDNTNASGDLDIGDNGNGGAVTI